MFLCLVQSITILQYALFFLRNRTWFNPYLPENNLKFLLVTLKLHNGSIQTLLLPGHIAQSVKCLATDAGQTADPAVASSIPVRSHTFMEIVPEIIFIQEGLLSVTSESKCTNYWLTACSSLPRKKLGYVNLPSRHEP